MTTPSGPGRFSQRTDKAVGEANRSLPNADYGEQAQYQGDQQGMQSQAPSSPSPDFASMFGSAGANVTGLGEPTAQPDTPVTDGAALGPGAGPEALSSTPGPSQDKLKAWLPALQYMADTGDSDSARNLVRQIQAQTM